MGRQRKLRLRLFKTWQFLVAPPCTIQQYSVAKSTQQLLYRKGSERWPFCWQPDIWKAGAFVLVASFGDIDRGLDRRWNISPEALAVGAVGPTLAGHRTCALPVRSAGSGVSTKGKCQHDQSGMARGSRLDCSSIGWSSSIACIPRAS